MDQNSSIKKLSLAGIIVTLGIVFGDIGTSPLYVMKAIVATNSHSITEEFIIGALSCIIWTLTLQTTIKYMIIALRADNNGEGGILALYSLVKRLKNKWLYVIAIIGASALVADGVITPSLTVISAVEGIQIHSPETDVIPITLIILIILFTIQQFGTNFIGRFFGPVMILWLLTLAILGLSHIGSYPAVFKAFNPYHAINLLIEYPHALLILGAVFLCTTGAEALYSDLGHCGIKNIQASWVFAKSCLIINYLGQGAWVLTHISEASSGKNPIFEIMPEWFIIPGVIIATLAAIVASQALISGSFTIFSEAMSLNFWPHQEIAYPTQIKGQMYIPLVNWSLLIMCIGVVLHFKESSKMDAAYGLAITLTMLCTSILLLYYLYIKKVKVYYIIIFGMIYGIIEGTFFYANLLKFFKGGWIAILLAGIIMICMYGWYNGRRLKNKYLEFVKIDPYLPILSDMKNDEQIPKFASNLVFISRAKRKDEIEKKIVYSIINKQPKRADHYWILHIKHDVNPYTFEYKVLEVIPGILYRVYFNLGFKVQPLVNIYFTQIIEDLVKSNEFNITSLYPSLKKHNIHADFKFILTDRVFDYDYMLTFKERFILRLYQLIKFIGISDTAALGLETHNVVVEKIPMLTDFKYKMRIKRNLED